MPPRPDRGPPDEIGPPPGSGAPPEAGPPPGAGPPPEAGPPPVPPGQNQGPLAFDDADSVQEDLALVASGNVLNNDTDPDTAAGDTKKVITTGTFVGTYGSLLLDEAGTYTYTLANDSLAVQSLPQGQSVTDVFTYTMSDGSGLTSSTTLTITIDGTNDGPVASDDSYSTEEDTPLSVSVAGVLTNDTDVDGDSLQAVLISGPVHGSLTLAADGSFSYTPDADYNGPDSFTYRASDATTPSEPLFQPSVQYSTGPGSRSAAIVDLDGDGNVDLIVENDQSSDLSVLYGNGDGTFQSQIAVAAAAGLESIAVVDLDDDGLLDLVGASNASVFLGQEDGTFGSVTQFAPGVFSFSVVTGDLDHDNDIDVAITDFGSPRVLVLLGNGTGAFALPTEFAVSANPFASAIRDLNADTHVDLVVTSLDDDSVSVLLGKGDGDFLPHMMFATGMDPASVAVGDLNGDTYPDLAVANHGSNDVSILLGYGDGTFQPQLVFAAGTGPHSVAIGDMDGDGRLDLAVANIASDDVSVLLGNGDGFFQDQATFAAGTGPSFVAMANLNSDSRVDLVVTGIAADPNYVSVLLNSNISAGLSSNIATVNLTVNSVNNAPTLTGGGALTYDSNGGFDRGNSLLMQEDGSFLLAGPIAGDFGVMRFHSDGTLDLGFANNGIATVDFGGLDQAVNMLIESDGQILLGGHSQHSNDDFAVARLNADGTVDATFGNNGRVITPIGGDNDFAFGMALQADGKVVLSGLSGKPSADVALVRYETDGTLDATFGSGGKVVTDFGTDSVAYSVAALPGGKILIGGGAGDFLLALYDEAGNLDPTFGSGGKVVTDFNSSGAYSHDLLTQTDGKFVLAGYGNGANSDIALARYNPDGSLDLSFDFDGKVITDFGATYERGLTTTLQQDGKILVAGVTSDGVAGDFAIARYNTNGSLDTTFDEDGRVSTSFGSGFAAAFSVKLQPDGAILVAGMTNNGGSDDIALVRFHPDGTLDTAFGAGLSDQVAVTGQEFSLTVPANLFADPDGDTLTYEALLPNAVDPWLDFDANTRTFSGTPGEADAGTFNIEIKAMDPGGLYASDIFALVVS